MECHSELVESLRNIALPYRTLARWIGNSQQRRVSTIEEQRSGRPASRRIDFARAVIEHLMDYMKGHGLCTLRVFRPSFVMSTLCVLCCPSFAP
ncbi:uncharacterized protein TNCV_1330821 [Trichonephila clavipes]|uniref:Uncharacterized protein n=1 Tax=Trichonephila clavipes TaxID=2585209 RepID=A0A8X6R4T7_TRICX|nr:uncharacterized protein TNCV_1330821 [Trichonephila clavipes]